MTKRLLGPASVKKIYPPKRLLGPASEKEIYTSKKLIVLWDETVMEWGIYRKNDREKVLQWIGDDERVVDWCDETSNVKVPEELWPLAIQRKAERKAEFEKREREREREEAREAREAREQAVRKEKYLASLSMDDREDILAREGNRERKRERKEAEYQKWKKDGMPGGPRIPDMIKKPEKPEEPGGPRIPDMIKKPEKPEEPEEVFPWEKG